MIFLILAPYLKGFHLTLDGWRADRDKEGWKDMNWERMLEHWVEKGDIMEKEREDLLLKKEEGIAPKRVPIMPRLVTDVEAMSKFFKGDKPLMTPVRL